MPAPMPRLFHVMMRETPDTEHAPLDCRDTVAAMMITVLHIDAFPHWREASERVCTTLRSLGHDQVDVVEVLLESSEQAAAVPFAGSPTILVDGVDLFPSDGGTKELACRVYPQ